MFAYPMNSIYFSTNPSKSAFVSSSIWPFSSKLLWIAESITSGWTETFAHKNAKEDIPQDSIFKHLIYIF